MRRGIDVSHQNIVTSWSAVKGDGIEFVFIKATEGVTVKDPMFNLHVDGAGQAGIHPYAYHFYRPKDSGIQQANNYLSMVGGISPIRRMAVDLEWCPNADGSEQWKEVDEPTRYRELTDFLMTLANTGLDIKIYTSYEFVMEFLPGAKFLGNYGLWLARYDNNSGPIPSMWNNKYEFWQYNDHGKVDGIQGDVDMNFANDGVSL